MFFGATTVAELLALARDVDDLRRFADQGVRRITLRITGWQQAEQYQRLVNDVLPKV